MHGKVAVYALNEDSVRVQEIFYNVSEKSDSWANQHPEK